MLKGIAIMSAHIRVLSALRYQWFYLRKFKADMFPPNVTNYGLKHNNILGNGWYCTCKNGSRGVGMYAHVTSVIWYLSYMRHEENSLKNIPNWANAIKDASTETVLDESDSDDPEE